MQTILRLLGLLILSVGVIAERNYRIIQIAKNLNKEHRTNPIRGKYSDVENYQLKFLFSTGVLQAILDYKRGKTTTTEAPTLTGTLTGTLSGTRNTGTGSGTTATVTNTGTATGTGTGTGTATGTGTGAGTATGTGTGTGTVTGTGSDSFIADTATENKIDEFPAKEEIKPPTTKPTRKTETNKKKLTYKVTTAKKKKPEKDDSVPDRIVVITPSESRWVRN